MCIPYFIINRLCQLKYPFVDSVKHCIRVVVLMDS